jgi:hypothetical protein
MPMGPRSLRLQSPIDHAEVMITAARSHPVETPAPVGDDLRTTWVAAYRTRIPSADRWARGLGHLTHTIETQERVFRMAEQLAQQGVARQELFTNLEEADRSVALAADPKAFARAGSRAVAPMVPLVGASIVICGDDDPDLRAFGFDPIPFDGHDPAAYAWTLFELTMRARADVDRLRCSCHPRLPLSAIGLARL